MQPTTLPSPLGRTLARFTADSNLSAPAARERYTRALRTGDLAPFPNAFAPAPHRIEESEADGLTTRKFLLKLRGTPNDPAGRSLPQVTNSTDLETESVIIPMRKRHGISHTLCVSSQVGCAMGCEFCETAQMGLLRSLTSEEILAQWFAAKHHLGVDITNIVFMGMGEPLDNIDAVIAAIEALTDHAGAAVAMRRITVSTVGRLDGIAKLREFASREGNKQLGLAVSINAPNDEIRNTIMPINKAMPLADLIPALERWPVKANSKICAEYVLIPGVNDAAEHADEIADRLRNVPCCLNVIPYNPRRNSPWPAPTEESVQAFLRRLESRGQFCKQRKTKGRDTMAACGQLGNENIRKRKLVTQ
ncbi:rlmN1 [Symbiodinium necroappetens]|uniref:RlmN1 protein n=1 Tax=Symbiodinium necroappetens TaxID=1628268 RepID=A0A813CKP6_9DINO|nr:rlmN1 [Symbiodinium necroappetens]